MKISKLNGLILLICMLFSQGVQTPRYTYQGGWPVNSRSDEILDPGFDLPCPGPIGCECRSDADCENQNCSSHPKGNYCIPKPGDLIPRFEAIDQFGEGVDLYDFANQGKMILIELCGAWAKPCNDFSSWLTSNDQKIKEYRWWKDRYLPIRDMIESGEIILIHIMSQGSEGNKSIATPKDVVEWYKKFPNPNIPILADEYKFMYGWVKPTAFPCILLVNEKMQLIKYTNRGLNDAFLYLTKPID